MDPKVGGTGVSEVSNSALGVWGLRGALDQGVPQGTLGTPDKERPVLSPFSSLSLFLPSLSVHSFVLFLPVPSPASE